MKKIYKALGVLIYTIILLVAVLLIWSILPVRNAPRLMMVLSGSMEPSIHTGSIVVIKPESLYKVGDVVTFGKDTKNNIPTTHRIVSTRAQDGVMVFKTKGDANNSEDVMEIMESDIHGKVLFSLPYAGYVVDLIKKPLGLILVIVIPAFFIIFDEIRKITKEVKKIKEAKSENSSEENV